LNDEAFGSLDDRDGFQIQHHDAALKQTAESQERITEDAAPKELPKSSNVPKKDTTKQDFILITSSGGPPEPNRHVSLNVVFYLSSITHQ
jgi:hypothetical protein